eukprot:TRINITY_DN994_c1_g1_i2.p1 TRINITY_DN994_c1_g1~~TRINITY_DN994_c1_g1_i2.p1  ORF type:complete len:369 (-),score=35.47 TRINITY_DN994_c1_g1_i2:262-1278(-)
MRKRSPYSHNACRNCKEKHLKCDGCQPCGSCTKKNVDCVYIQNGTHRKKRRTSESSQDMIILQNKLQNLQQRYDNLKAWVSSRVGCEDVDKLVDSFVQGREPGVGYPTYPGNQNGVEVNTPITSPYNIDRTVKTFDIGNYQISGNMVSIANNSPPIENNSPIRISSLTSGTQSHYNTPNGEDTNSRFDTSDNNTCSVTHFTHGINSPKILNDFHPNLKMSPQFEQSHATEHFSPSHQNGTTVDPKLFPITQINPQSNSRPSSIKSIDWPSLSSFKDQKFHPTNYEPFIADSANEFLLPPLSNYTRHISNHHHHLEGHHLLPSIKELPFKDTPLIKTEK